MKEIKSFIEKETGLKVTVKKEALNSSMRGYLTFTLRNTKESKDWGIDFARLFKKTFIGTIEHPTFCNKYSASVFIGNEIYNVL